MTTVSQAAAIGLLLLIIFGAICCCVIGIGILVTVYFATRKKDQPAAMQGNSELISKTKQKISACGTPAQSVSTPIIIRQV